MIAFFPSRRVFLEIGDFAIHWYGIMYLLAFLVAWWLLPRLQQSRGLGWSEQKWSNALTAAVLGVLVGGRLGYVLFYEPTMLWNDPLEVFAVWHGGMASHGGFIGVAIALLWVLRHDRADILKVADIVTIPIAIGLALGRFGNFINQELYGSVTTLPWGIAIPGEEGLRHPTQLYAVAKDLFLAALCFWHLRRIPIVPGRTCSLFLIGYGVLRFLIEYLRIQDHEPLALGILVLTRGQLLTLPLIAAGVLLWWFVRRDASAMPRAESAAR